MDKKTKAILAEHSRELYRLKHLIRFYVYCMDNEIYADNKQELFCFGKMVSDYMKEVKEKFNDIALDLNLDI